MLAVNDDTCDTQLLEFINDVGVALSDGCVSVSMITKCSHQAVNCYLDNLPPPNVRYTKTLYMR